MKKWHRMGICLILTVCLLVLPACKNKPATDSTGATDPISTGTIATDATENAIPAEIAFYQATYPQCFDLSMENGLEISVWHRASGVGAGYYCDLLPGREEPYTIFEAYELDQTAVPMEAMRKIVAYYIDTGAITKEQVTLKCVDMPSFSENDRKADYIQGFVDYYFWADDAIFQYVNTSDRMIVDLATFDIDGDGAQEQIALFPGLMSISRCMELMVCQDGVVEYWNQFEEHGDWQLALVETASGKVQLLCTEYDRIAEGNNTKVTLSDRTHTFDFGVADGNVILTNDTEQRFTYYGAQGPDNANWPKQ